VSARIEKCRHSRGMTDILYVQLELNIDLSDLCTVLSIFACRIAQPHSGLIADLYTALTLARTDYNKNCFPCRYRSHKS
jgi:hypothetical protein